MIVQSSPKARTRAHRAGAPAVTASAPKIPNAGDAYRLSRVQAEGWNAANRIAASTLDGLNATQIERLNPYAADPERTRWSTGFKSALTS